MFISPGMLALVTGLFVVSALAMSSVSSLRHHVYHRPLNERQGGTELARFGMGCFWGAERKFWQRDGVVNTSVGYSGGPGRNPSYEDVCTGTTDHAEVVQVEYDPAQVSYKELLDVFWTEHDPTQVDRQGNDSGTQYRSVVFYFSEDQKATMEATRSAFQKKLTERGKGKIATQLLAAKEHPYYYAEGYHQQYLYKNPWGYCGLQGTGCYHPDEISSLMDLMKELRCAG